MLPLCCKWFIKDLWIKESLNGKFYTQTSLKSVLEVLDWQLLINAYLNLLAPRLNNKGVLSYAKEIGKCLAFNNKYSLLRILKHLEHTLSEKKRLNRYFERKSIIDGGRWYRGKGLK